MVVYFRRGFVCRFWSVFLYSVIVLVLFWVIVILRILKRGCGGRMERSRGGKWKIREELSGRGVKKC